MKTELVYTEKVVALADRFTRRLYDLSVRENNSRAVRLVRLFFPDGDKQPVFAYCDWDEDPKEVYADVQYVREWTIEDSIEVMAYENMLGSLKMPQVDCN